MSADAGSRKALLIIVTFNSYEMISDLVGSVREFVQDSPHNHAVVIENSSDQRVRKHFETHLSRDRVRVELAQRNDGFSRGVNLGYQLARDQWGTFDFIVLLNPDVASAGSVVCELVNRAAAGSTAQVGVSGVVLRDSSGDLDRGCARRVWNRRRLFSHLVGYHDLVRALRTAPRSLNEYEIAHDQSELAMVSGGLMCISASVMAGGLDTLLPMYLEDQEICLRSLRQGLAVRLHADLALVHIGGVSRKSVTDHEHALRIMELVEAPVLCMHRLQGYGITSLRFTVVLGGVSRLAATYLSATFKILLRPRVIRDELAWATAQQRLSIWFIRWGVRGKAHERDVSLDDYFQEYASL